jgi:hypothetical protein
MNTGKYLKKNFSKLIFIKIVFKSLRILFPFGRPMIDKAATSSRSDRMALASPRVVLRMISCSALRIPRRFLRSASSCGGHCFRRHGRLLE